MARSGIMLAYPYEEKRLQKWNVPYVLVQPKLDGERCRAIIENGNVLLISSEQHEILSVPHINQELSELWEGTVELDGELYIHGASFDTIHSIVGRTVNLHEDYSYMTFNIFDVVNNLQQVDRSRWLSNFPQSPSVSVLPTDIARIDQIETLLSHYQSDGYEGIIVRHPFNHYERKRSTQMMKFKPKKQDLYMIIDWEEAVSETGTPLRRLGALWCEKDGEKFKVSCGATSHDALRTWFEQRELLIGKWANVHYQNLTSGRNIPRFGRMNLEIDLVDFVDYYP